MERTDLFKKLADLAQLDYDAVRVYDEALEHTTEAEITTAFEHFRSDHKNHYEQLTEWIGKLGGEQPRLHVDVMGHAADWLTSIRSLRGTAGAVHAMRTAEKYHNSHYAKAAEWDVDNEEVATMLRRFYNDERQHLEFVESHLKTPAGARE